jgi:asparagine synthase (glutamine-hydrolysing)
MCGIFGCVSSDLLNVDYKKNTDTLLHRGPDDSGYYTDDHIALGHRRLSIIDVEGSHQPILNQNNDIVIIFNGEIYNYLDLRAELQRKGYVFTTHGDTETILHAYEEWGENCVSRLTGMFSFAIWNKTSKELFIARDRLGIKPLFYTIHNNSLYFASEIKAITADARIKLEIDDTALASYFTLSYIPAPYTIYKNIHKLLPGHVLTWKAGRHSIKKYWDIHFVPDRSKSESYFIDGILEHLKKSVESHMISDVPIGAFLSGGVDSSAVVAFMSQSTAEPVNTYCIGFGGSKGGYLDERVYAEMVAKRFSTRHKQLEVTPSVNGILDHIINAFDEPFADDSSIPSYFVSKIAQENVKVVLSGLGGDELFAGYERYLGFRLQSFYNKVPYFIRKNLISNIVDRIPERSDGHYTINHMKRFARGGLLEPDRCYLSYISMLSDNMRSSLFVDRTHFNEHYEICANLMMGHFNSDNVHGKKDSLDRALYCDIKTYLPDDILALSDRVSMQHSLEVRVPFIDHEFMEFCATIPPETRLKGFKKKYLLKKALTNIIPEEVINHRKQGFVGPTASWMRSDLKQLILNSLTRNELEKHGYIKYETVSRILDEHFTGKQLHDKLIWSLLIFQKWFTHNESRLN